jgi:hypothetical protein
MRIDWSKLTPLLLFALGAAAYALVYVYYGSHDPIDSDGHGYYAYLPAYLINHDGSMRTVLFHDILPQYSNTLPPAFFGFSLQPSGAYLDKYGVGVALLLLPFFAVGHGVAVALGFPATGYSPPEELIVGAGALVYTFIGLLLLRAFLKRWFSDGVVALTLVAVTLGTGVMAYLSFQPAFSHDFSFFAVALMLLSAQRWYELPGSWWRAAALGLACGMVAAIRLPNAALWTVVPLLGITGLRDARARLALFQHHAARVAVAGACTALPLVPQVLTWYAATGHLLTRPYPGESFDFLHPHLLEALVWLQPHGMLSYYPVLGLALIGIGVAWRRNRGLALPVTAGFLLFFYLVSAWWDWSYSDAFGDRAFIDVAPLLAVPLAVLMSSMRSRRALRAVVSLGAVLVVVTCVMTIAYFQRRLPGDGISASGYVHVFLDTGRLLRPGPR